MLRFFVISCLSVLSWSRVLNVKHSPTESIMFNGRSLSFELREAINKFKSKLHESLNLPLEMPQNNFESATAEVPEDFKKFLQIEDYEKLEHVMVRPSNGVHRCKKDISLCNKYEFSLSAIADEILTTQLLLHKSNPLDSIIVSAYSSNSDGAVVTLQENGTQMNRTSKLIEFELPKQLIFETQADGRLHCSLEIEGTLSDELPTLLITREIPIKKDRKRRSSSNKSGCRKEDLEFGLEDLGDGWDKYIIEPTEFNIRQCTGQCPRNRNTQVINHSNIANSLYSRNNSLARPECPFWLRQCRPLEFEPLTIMYWEWESNFTTVIQHSIKDVVIKRCVCV